MTGPAPVWLKLCTVPVWRSAMNSVRASGGTMSPLSFGQQLRPHEDEVAAVGGQRRVQLVVGVLTPAGSAIAAPVAALTRPIWKPLPVT